MRLRKMLGLIVISKRYFFQSGFVSQRLQLAAIMLLGGFLGLPSRAWAAGGDAGSGNPWLDLLWKAINFTVLAGLIYYFAHKPVGTMLKNNANAIQAKMLSLQNDASKTADALSAYQAQLIDDRATLETMIATSAKALQQEQAQLMAQANAQAETAQKQLEQQLVQVAEKAKQDLRIELIERIVSDTSHQLQTNITPDQAQNLVKKNVTEMEWR